MLGPAAQKEGPTAGLRGGAKRGADAGIPGVVGAVRRPSGHERAVGGASAGGRADELPRRAGPYDAGAKRSAGFFGGRDRRDHGDQREYGEGEVVPGAAENHGACPAKAGSREIDGLAE